MTEEKAKEAGSLASDIQWLREQIERAESSIYSLSKEPYPDRIVSLYQNRSDNGSRIELRCPLLIKIIKRQVKEDKKWLKKSQRKLRKI